ncbi:clathrin heavy chain, putative [Babesia bigemina]|uniref:Clathrin heavy chain n=1 Tax=Babesia bigemina TaxID=5866 RepID=A0A061DCV6_BABBI|nr:clathrin heavy chain, putative [Babesia bigemina]CDR98027.1 clathrin heavy chain, putative [Babesia bigemina]|eukprot:XP_012770213.1 clathrin heavy chain, putative [Babesia bigemina]
MAGAPVNVTTVLRLKDLGFDDGCFRFGTLTLGGDRFVCVRESEGASPSVAIIDLHKGGDVSRRPIKAEATIMHPNEFIIALKASVDGGHFVQVFHLETKEKLGAHQFSEAVVFWRWISSTTLAVVTTTSVYHWTVRSGEPVLMFARSGKLADPSTKLVHYASDDNAKWCMVCGIYSLDQGATVEGSIQLYSTERRQQQLLEGYTGTFGRLRISKDNFDTTGLLVFCEHKRGAQTSKLHCMDIYTQRTEGAPAPLKVSKEIENIATTMGDFPIFVQILDSCGLICVLTKNGFAHYHDAATALPLFSRKISDVPLFVADAKRSEGKAVGVIAVNRSGDVVEAIVDENRLLSALSCPDEVRVSLATRFGYPGSENLVMRSFEDYFSRRDYKQAARLVASLKNGALRTPEIMERFVNAPALPGESAPALHYFSVLLEHGRLTARESIELVRPVVAQGREELVKKWLDEGKLTESEELADLVRSLSPLLAFKINVSLGSHFKAIMCLLDAGHAEKVVPYIRKIPLSDVTYVTGSTGDRVAQIPGLPSMDAIVDHMVNSRSADIVGFVNDLIAGLGPGECLCDVGQVTEVLIKNNKLQELTKILLEYLKPNREQHAALQTRLLEVNLQQQPRVGEMILQMNVLTHYDRSYIARLCESADLFDLAVKHHTSLFDIKRIVIKAGGKLSRGIFETTMKAMTPEQALEVIRDMADSSDVGNHEVVSSALSLHNHIGTMQLVQTFERSGSSDLLFLFLKALPVISQAALAEKTELNATLVYKFIQCCIDRAEYDDLERVCKESNCYDGLRVKELLKQSALPSPKSLMIVCHKLGDLAELTEYLYRNGMEKAIEIYVNTINPGGVAAVVSALFDIGAAESTIHSILENLKDSNGMIAMIKVADERHQLLMLKDWLQKRVNDGYKETEIHTALAKIRVSSQQDAEEFLRTNTHYDRAVVGKFCEERDPMLAYLIYSQATMDDDVLRVCAGNSLHRMLASYALKRSSARMWREIFSADSTAVKPEDRKHICEELVSLAPESSNAAEISCVLKALLDANMDAEVIALLEQLLLTQTQFASSGNLQNLLLATAVRTNPEKLEEYLPKLDNYDVTALSKLATSLGRTRSSFSILKNAGRHLDALDALLNMKEEGILKEAQEYVESVDQSEMWFRLGRAYLEHKELSPAIDAYVRSGNPSDHERIKEACGKDTDLLLRWLRECRKVRENRQIDTDLLLCLAESGNTDEFREVLSAKNCADVAYVGSKLMEAQRYAEAVIVYSSVPNHSKLAVCHLNLDNFEQAAETALKARNPQVLRQVVETCVLKNQLAIAHNVAIELLTYPDFLPGIVAMYENTGNVQEVIHLLENSERSVAVCTELAIAVAKYRPDDLLAHFKNRYTGESIRTSLNIARVARECCNLWLWREAIYLYRLESPDKALMSMVSHYGLAWDEEVFFAAAGEAANPEALYKAIHFCIQCEPMLLTRLLISIKNRVDPIRVIKILKNADCLGIAREYLEAVADKSNPGVNDALLEVYVEEEEHELLERSIVRLAVFDQQALCAKLEGHRLPQMRSIAGVLYARSRDFSKSALIHRRNGDFAGAIKAVNMSRSESLALEMAKYFIEHGLREEFVACLTVNFGLLEPADILELAWVNALDLDILMPFMIQTLRTIPRNAARSFSAQQVPQPKLQLGYR